MHRFNDALELEDAIHTAILTLKETFEGVMNEENIEIGIVETNQKFIKLTPDEIKDYLSNVI